MKRFSVQAFVVFCTGAVIASSLWAQQSYDYPIYYSGAVQPVVEVGYAPQTTVQYTAYESTPEPMYYSQTANVVASYPETVSYAQPTSYPETVVYSQPASQPIQVVYSEPVVTTPQPVSGTIVQAVNQSYPISNQPITNSYSAVGSYPMTTSQSQVSIPPTQTYAVASNNVPTTYPAYPTTQPVQTYTSMPVTSSQPAPIYSQPVMQPYSTNYNTGSSSVVPGLAQQKAQQAAQMGMRGHLGSGLGGARYEGVGWSNQSAQHAIQNCCYWGSRPTAQIGVSQGADGVWYACVLYH